MPCRYKEVEVLLNKLEKHMILEQLWSNVPPSKIALNSLVPFACDQMPFEHWLQFIFIPRMMEIVTSRNNLPERLSLMPMAEQCFLGQPELSQILLVIAEIDRKFEDFSKELRG